MRTLKINSPEVSWTDVDQNEANRIAAFSRNNARKPSRELVRKAALAAQPSTFAKIVRFFTTVE